MESTLRDELVIERSHHAFSQRRDTVLTNRNLGTDPKLSTNGTSFSRIKRIPMAISIQSVVAAHDRSFLRLIGNLLCKIACSQASNCGPVTTLADYARLANDRP
jgi:hypothetical protein